MTNTTEILADSPHEPHGGVAADDPRWGVLHRTLESETFRRSQRLREFLCFVGTHALNGRAEEISEYQIGAAVFNRRDRFNPTEDNIVRATARSLRNKLRDYFDREGAHEHYRIEIPKGGYTPVFVAVEPQMSGTAEMPRRRFHAGVAALLVTALCLAGVVFWLAAENAKLRSRPPETRGARNLLSALLGEDFHLNVVVSDTLHGHMVIRQGNLPRIEDYANGSVFGEIPPRGPEPISEDLWAMVRVHQMTQAEEAAAAANIAQELGSRGKVKVYHARSLTMTMLQMGDHFVLLGGRRANPWSGLFEQDVNFEMDFPERGKAAVFRNKRPLPGEETVYANSLDAKNTGRIYARIVLRPGLTGTGKVLLANGNTGVATAAAASLLIQPRVLTELESHLGRRVDSSLHDLEMIIENTVVGGNSKDIRIVAIR